MTASAPRLVARNAAVRVAGEVLAKLASLAFFIVMARQLGEAGFGEFQFALALTGALVYVAGFGADDLIAREVARDRGRAGRLLADASAIKLLGGILMVGVAVVIVNVGEYGHEARWVVYLVGLGTLLEVLSKSWFSVFQGHERLDLASATLILQRTATAAAGIVVLAAGGGVVAAASVYLAGSVIAVVAAESLLRRLGVRRAALDPRGWQSLTRTAIPIGLISLLSVVLLRVDVLMLSFLGDASKVGIYSVSFRLVEATQFLGSALAAAMLPWLTRAARTGAVGVARGYGLGLKAINVLLLPIGLVFVLFAEGIVDLLYGAEFDGAVLPLRLLGLMTLVFGLNAFAAIALVARDRPGAYARLIVPVIVVNVAFNFVLIPRYGPNGAAIDATCSSLLLAALAIWQARVVLGPSDLVGAFVGPMLGGAGMAGVVLAAHLPWPLEAALGVVVYAIIVACFEWFMRRDDARLFLRVLAPHGSGSRAGRTTA